MLRQKAIKQAGYFTAAQALALGFATQHQSYHIRAGHWIRIARGLFRLPGFADGLEADCIRWCLWSRNQKDQPQAVVSHETSLACHRQTGAKGVPIAPDTVSSRKIHLTVPPGFKKDVPGNIEIHHDRLLPEEIETHEAFRRTTLARTLRDLNLQGLALETSPVSDFPYARRHWHIGGLKRVSVYAELHTPEERERWQAVVDAYRKQLLPFKIETCFDAHDKAAALTSDLCFASPMLFGARLQDWAELDDLCERTGALRAGELLDGVLDVARYDGRLKAFPVLRSKQVIMANPGLLAKYGVSLGDIRTPADIFRVGARIEEQSGGLIRGCNFLSTVANAMPYGVDFQYSGQRMRWDEGRMRTFLSAVKPFIKPHHIIEMNSFSRTLFIQGKQAMQQAFLYEYDELKVGFGAVPMQLRRQGRQPKQTAGGPPLTFKTFPQICHMSQRSDIIPWPTTAGGFVGECFFLGMIRRDSQAKKEAFELLAHVVSAEGQRIFAGHTPLWLSVHREALRQQEAASPFPEGSVSYPFEYHSYRHLRDPLRYSQFAVKFNSAAVAFFLGRQTLDQTIAEIRAA